ncbi:MAG: hypothetical protein AAAFM81_13615 [Pseudomonadota bacterium]
MRSNFYIVAGLAAFALAVLYPGYWIIELSFLEEDFDNGQIINGLHPNDVLFLVVGVLNAAFYLFIRRVLVDDHNYTKLNIVFSLMVALCAVFYGGTFVLDMLHGIVSQTLLLDILLFVSVGCLIAFGILDLVIGALLIVEKTEMPTLIKAYALVSIVLGFLELTVIGSPLSLFVFPISALLMGIHFMRPPEVIEIV